MNIWYNLYICICTYLFTFSFFVFSFFLFLFFLFFVFSFFCFFVFSFVFLFLFLLFFCFFVFSFLFPFRYAHKHDKSYADTPESIRADGYVYEISFQETLQELAVRVGKALNKTVPDQIEQELNMKLAEKRDGKYSKRRERAIA